MIYNLILARWQTMTDGEKAPFIAAVNTSRLQMSPWNYFVKKARKDLYSHLGLAGYWSVNQITTITPLFPWGDPSYVFLDLAGKNYNGTLGPSALNDAPFLVPGLGGKFGRAVSFDGINDQVNLGDVKIASNRSILSFEAWLKPASTSSGHHRVFTKEAVLYVGRNGPYISFFGGTSSSWIDYWSAGEFGTITADIGAFVVWVKNGTSYKVYKNGQLAGSETGSLTTLGDCNYGDAFGIYSPGETYQLWDGLMDELRFYHRALEQPEIQKHYEIYSKYK